MAAAPRQLQWRDGPRGAAGWGEGEETPSQPELSPSQEFVVTPWLGHEPCEGCHHWPTFWVYGGTCCHGLGDA